MKYVIKKNGTKVQFNPDRLRQAIRKTSTDHEELIYEQVINVLREDTLTAQQIQNNLESVLLIFDPSAHHRYREYVKAKESLQDVHPDAFAISDYIHAAKYARVIDGKRETYEQTVDRVISFYKKRCSGDFSDIRKMILDKRVLPSMRAMQFAGPAAEAHNARLYNCSFTQVTRRRVFGDTLYLLLCGCGVGYSVQKHHVEMLPEISEGELAFHFVKDTIEGWANAIHLLVDNPQMEFDYSLIRRKGSPLKTSGGFAPGHLPLKTAIERIRPLLKGKLRPIDCHDIMCHLAECVLSGGIRRSSLIALFSPEDAEMMLCKEGMDWRSHRAMANNSVVTNDPAVFREAFDLAIRGYGEPGFFSSPNREYGTNPCGEIGLDPGPNAFAFCNLTEINLAKCKDRLDFYEACEVASCLGTIQASYTAFPFLGETTEIVAKTQALLGVSLTGVVDCPFKCDRFILKEGVKIVKRTNEAVSLKLNINEARRLTCVKPSGTASLLLGCVGSGVHPHHAKRYFRRITANPLEPVAQLFKKMNPACVEEKPNGDWCLTFPIEFSAWKPESWREFLDRVLLIYENWVKPGTREGDLTHNVSATMVVPREELKEAREEVALRLEKIAAMSFLPAMSDKEIPFMPREAVVTIEDIGKWRRLALSLKKVDYRAVDGITDLGSACEGVSCELR